MELSVCPYSLLVTKTWICQRVGNLISTYQHPYVSVSASVFSVSSSILSVPASLCQRISIRIQLVSIRISACKHTMSECQHPYFSVSSSVCQFVSIRMPVCQRSYVNLSASECQRVGVRMSAYQLTLRCRIEATATKVMTVSRFSPICCKMFCCAVT